MDKDYTAVNLILKGYNSIVTTPKTTRICFLSETNGNVVTTSIPQGQTPQLIVSKAATRAHLSITLREVHVAHAQVGTLNKHRKVHSAHD